MVIEKTGTIGIHLNFDSCKYNFVPEKMKHRFENTIQKANKISMEKPLC